MKIKNSIAFKTWLAMTAMVLVILLSLGLSLASLIENYFLNEKAYSLYQHGRAIASFPRNKNLGQFLYEVQTARTFIDADIMVIDKNGVIITCGTKMGMKTGLHLNTQEVKQVLSGQFIKKMGYHEQFKEAVLTIAIPMYKDKKIDGAVLLYTPYKDYFSTFASIQYLILYAAIGAIILTTILSFFLSKTISKPLISMQKAALKIAGGDFTTKVQINSKDEVGSLGSSINYMANSLSNYTKALSQEKEKLFNILDNMSEAVLVFNHLGQVTLFNHAAQRLLENLSLGMDFNKIFANNRENVWETLKTKKILREIDFHINNKNLAANLSILQKENFNGIIMVLIDVTQKKKSEQIRKEFIASISHELRTPLTFIQGYSEALLDNMLQSEDDKIESLKTIKIEAIRLKSLVNDLVDLNQLELGHFTFNKSNTDLSSLVQQIIRKYNSIAISSNIDISVQIIGNHQKYIFVDTNRIQQVCINLLDNAFRHTPSNGKIQITLEYQVDKVIIKIADNGSGIPNDDLPLIWERFYKVDKARTRQGGTGLGLAIVKEIIEGHNGTINVESTLGKGTEFQIILPYN
ncbi:ATP-binding protein [Bacillota bacterium LX-D]|nr:ATP-binding protein [Bacillota bacterium LX-D]